MGATGMAVGSSVSGIASLFGASSQADAMKSQGEYQKTVADFNAQLSELQAQDAIDRGGKEAQQVKMQAKQMIGSQRAVMAANGVSVDTGSAAEVQADTQKMATQDAITIRNNAAREAWGYKTQALNYTTQGNMAKNAGAVNAGNTLLTGGLGAVSNFANAYGYSKQGAPAQESPGSKPTMAMNYNAKSYKPLA